MKLILGGKKVIAGVDQKVLFNGGKLAISDTSYTLADSKVYSEALGKVDDSGVGANAKTTIVMTGTLQDQPVDNKATVDDRCRPYQCHRYGKHWHLKRR